MKIALTTVCNDKYMRLTKVCLYSFMKHNKWFDGDIIIIHDNGEECGLSEENKEVLRKIGKNVKFHCVDINDYRKVIEHFKGHLDKNLNSSLYKLDVFDFGDYDKIIQVDGDMLFLDSVQELTELEGLSICEDSGLREVFGNFICSLPNNNRKRNDEYCNAGLFVLDRSITEQRLKGELIKLGEILDLGFMAPYSPLDKKWVEQDIINIYFYGKDVFLLSNEYNLSKRNFHNNINQGLEKYAKIIHYLADKPYEYNKYYTYINALWLNEEKEMKEALGKEYEQY